MMSTVRIELPAHLRTLAGVGREVTVEVEGTATLRAAIDALEARYPTLRGTIRDQVTHQRRPFLRFFACRKIYRTIHRTSRYRKPS